MTAARAGAGSRSPSGHRIEALVSLGGAALIALTCAADRPRAAMAVAAAPPTTLIEPVAPGGPARTRLHAPWANRMAWRESGAAQALVDMLARASAEGLDPSHYAVEPLRARLRQRSVDAGLDLALSRALLSYLHDLRTPTRERTNYVDAELAPARVIDEALQASATAGTPRDRLASLHRMHPLYEGLRAALADYRTTGAHPSQLPGPAYEQRLLLNMDRLRMLPADPDRRHVLVDTASARLWLYEGGVPVDSMRVIVGKRRMQTPPLAGLIRFAVLRPYWNLPPDLARERAARVVRDGTDFLRRDRMEVLSGWGTDARILDPVEVNWLAVASGVQAIRMRQLPGPENMMGAVKFMLPNRLGIYLHDTPDKASFTRQDRRLSSGCVRVEDARRLFLWLLGRAAPTGAGTAEQKVELSRPVPVYIVHLTALPEGGEIRLQQDAYRRDRT